MPATSRPRGGATSAIVLAGAAAGVLAASLAARLLSSAPPVWDDAYMFFRYATNLSQEGRIVWNPGGPPTWGATSLLYVVLVQAARALSPDPLRALLGASFACGLLLLVLLVWVARAYGGSLPSRGAAAVLVLFVVAFQARPLSAHFLSGMDTTFSASWLAGYLLLADRQRRAPTTAGAIVQGAFGALAFVIRPELLVFAAVLPAATVALGRSSAERRSGVLAGGSALAGALGLAALAASYFGAPLPLPFYVKTAGVYGETMRRVYEGVGPREWLLFASSNAPCLGLTAFAAVRRRRSGVSSGDALGVGLLGALLVYGVFHAFLVTPIMFYEQRFHYPVLPALVALGALGWAELREHHARFARAVVAGALVILAWPAARRGIEIVSSLRASGGATAPLSIGESYAASREVWLGLDRLAQLPDDLVLATTEVGHPGVICPGKAILDLSGLNDPSVASGRLAPEAIFRGRPPDWIYLPHEDYREYVAALTATSFFKARYEVHGADRLGTVPVRVWDETVQKPYFLGVAILRGGPHEAACRQVLEFAASPASIPAAARRRPRRRRGGCACWGEGVGVHFRRIPRRLWRIPCATTLDPPP